MSVENNLCRGTEAGTGSRKCGYEKRRDLISLDSAENYIKEKKYFLHMEALKILNFHEMII